MLVKTLVCCDCGAWFALTPGERNFYRQMKFPKAPRRCRACREARRLYKQRKGYVSDQWGGGVASP